MNTDAIAAFVTVVDTGSINAAAKRLGLSQPALSKALRALETSYAVPLLIRSRSGVSPTEFGTTLYRHFHLIAAELETARQNIAQMRGQFEGQLSVAFGPAPATDILPRAMRVFRKAHPGIRFVVRESVYPRVGAQLTSGLVDLAFGPLATIPDRGALRIEPLVDYPLCIVAPPNHPLALATDLAELSTADWLQIGDSGAASETISLTFEQNGLHPPEVLLECHAISSAKALLYSQSLLALLPKVLVQDELRHGTLVTVPVAQPLASNMCGLIFSSDRPVSQACDLLATYIRRIADQINHATRLSLPQAQ